MWQVVSYMRSHIHVCCTCMYEQAVYEIHQPSKGKEEQFPASCRIHPDHIWQPGPFLATKSGPGSDQFWQRKVIRPDQFSRDRPSILPTQLYTLIHVPEIEYVPYHPPRLNEHIAIVSSDAARCSLFKILSRFILKMLKKVRASGAERGGLSTSVYSTVSLYDFHAEQVTCICAFHTACK